MKKLFILIQLMASSLILASNSPSSSSNSSTPTSSPRGIVSAEELKNLERQAKAVSLMSQAQGYKKIGDNSPQSYPSGRISPQQAQDLITTQNQLIMLKKQADDLQKQASAFKKVAPRT